MQLSRAEEHSRVIATAQREQREAAARYTIQQQRACAGRWWIDDEHPGAWAGLCDWLMEECLLEWEARYESQ